MDAIRILAAGVLLGGATFGQSVERAAKSDIERAAKSGDSTLLDELMKSGVHLDDLERLVRELAKLDRPALPSDGKPVVRRVVKVVKGGSGADGGCAPLPTGFDVTGLEELIEQSVADALAGRLPDPKELERRARKIRVNGAPADVQTEVLSGAEALAELERRCPELAGELDSLLREVGGSLDGEFARQSSRDAASSSDSRRSSDRSTDRSSARDADRSRDAERRRSGTVAPADPRKRVAPTPSTKLIKPIKPTKPAKPAKPAKPVHEVGV